VNWPTGLLLLGMSDAQWGLVVTALTALVAVLGQLVHANLNQRHEREVRGMQMAHEQKLSRAATNRERKEDLYIGAIERMLAWQGVLESTNDLPKLRETTVITTSDPLATNTYARLTAFSSPTTLATIRRWCACLVELQGANRGALSGNLTWTSYDQRRVQAIDASRALVNALSTELTDAEE
jgi:hypothetical protein